MTMTNIVPKMKINYASIKIKVFRKIHSQKLIYAHKIFKGG